MSPEGVLPALDGSSWSEDTGTPGEYKGVLEIPGWPQVVPPGPCALPILYVQEVVTHFIQ